MIVRMRKLIFFYGSMEYFKIIWNVN